MDSTIDYLLDRLLNEARVSGGLYVALVGLTTILTQNRAELDGLDVVLLRTVAEAMAEYETLHQ